MTATQRTLKLLRDLGWQVATVERWIPKLNRRLDVWGFGDILACKPGHPAGTILVQSTTGTNLAAHRTKIEGIPQAKVWMEAGNWIVLIAWRKLKPRGTKVAKWEPIIEIMKHEGNK
jgi:hypothetical protein